MTINLINSGIDTMDHDANYRTSKGKEKHVKAPETPKPGVRHRELGCGHKKQDPKESNLLSLWGKFPGKKIRNWTANPISDQPKALRRKKGATAGRGITLLETRAKLKML